VGRHLTDRLASGTASKPAWLRTDPAARAWDFIAGATVRGGTLRILTIPDEYTRECHVQRADRALRAGDALEWFR
jgi:hypothetical protein